MIFMKKTVQVILILSISFLCLSSSNLNKRKDREFKIYVSPFKPVHFSNDHASEGFLSSLKDGSILLIFRIDPGIEGDHVGTNAFIAKIPYDPQKDQWGKIDTVFDDPRYDDRNIHGGVTKDGRIILFFRKYDGKETENRYFMYSNDRGRTWSEPQRSSAWSDPVSSKISGIWSTGQMFHNPDIDKYIMVGCQRYITYSKDGTSWEEYNLITDNNDYRLSEIAAAWCGNNRIIALIRDDQREYGHPLVQVESHDNGKTWTQPVQTNIPPKKHWGAAPQLIYDQKRDLLIALTSDRYSRPNEQNRLFIYAASPDEVFGKPEGWKLQHELLRPWASLDFKGERPLNQNLYGYPTIAPINKNEYLVVFTERAVMHGSEQADLYYFRMIIK